MNANEFFDLVTAELEKRGIPNDFAQAKLDQIKQRISKLDENDAEKFYSEGNYKAVIEKICTSYESEIKSKDTIALTQTFEEVQSDKESDDRSDKVDGTHAKMTVVSPTTLPESTKKETVISKLVSKLSVASGADKRDSLIMLVTVLIVFLPLLAVLTVAGLGVFAGASVALAGSILLIIAVIFVVVLGGSVLSLASLLFGVSQLLGDTKYIGFHEVGLGLVFVGITMLVGIVLYNVAVRLIPLIYRLLGKLFVLTCKLFKKWVASVVKGCEKL